MLTAPNIFNDFPFCKYIFKDQLREQALYDCGNFIYIAILYKGMKKF